MNKTGDLICALIILNLAAGCGISESVSNTPSSYTACRGTEQETNRLFLQQVTDQSAAIRWRGPATEICIGTRANSLNRRVAATMDGDHMQAEVIGLTPDTVYFYSVGGAPTTTLAQSFRTAPSPGHYPDDGNIRIWIVGDSGTATEMDDEGNLQHPGEAAAVRDGYALYNAKSGGNEATDLFLQLGDTAYPTGTDAEWQGAFFDLYADTLKTTPALGTIGNHGMGVGPFDFCLYRHVPECDAGPIIYMIGGASTSADPASYDSNGDGPDPGGLPYLSIFDLPSQGEQGGVPSGTELYYSANYGALHLVSLDSQLSTQDPDRLAAMRLWLIDDLSRNDLDWTVVVFHHPPYSKGQHHDSDVERREIDMREAFAPVFEAQGVDLIYSGHSHSYERSYYLHGHHGLSDTFDAAVHAELGPDGLPSLGQIDDPYRQVSRSSGKDDKAVYTVAGNGGKAGHYNPCPEGQTVGCTMPDWLTHPAHRRFEKLGDDYLPNGIARIGSVVLDVSIDRLVSRLIDEDGEVLDYFIIEK
ncbi:MAG: metallophosphoesterase family protein [Pseudomonadota bacterium]